MTQRKRNIDRACRQALKRDDYTCQCCGREKSQGWQIDPAHLLPRNHPAPDYDAANPDHIVTLCRECHMSYDRVHTFETKLDWFIRRRMWTQMKRLLAVSPNIQEEAS